MINNQFLFFITDGNTYGIDVLNIESIERIGSITRVPKAPKATIGVMNLRGTIVPVVSFRQKLGLALGEFNDEMRIIVLDVDEDRVGILVDKILDVKEIDIEDMYFDADAQRSDIKEFIKGAVKYEGETLISILDSGKLMESQF